MKQKIFEWIGKHDRLRYLLKVLRGIGDEKFVYNVNHLYDGMMSMIAVQKGEKNKGKIIYNLNISSQSGFFAVMDHILHYLYYADSLGLYPVITLDTKFLYFEQHGIDGIYNPWEYYFEQYNGLNADDLKNSYRVVDFHYKDFELLFQELGRKGYYYEDKYINEMAQIYKKYIHLNKKTKKYINESILSLFQNKRILGVHVRMGGMLLAPDGHPIVPSLEEYIKEIYIALDKGKFEKIFLATDDEGVVKLLKKEFGVKMIYYTETARTKGKIDTVFVDRERPDDKYLCGLEVLRDMYTLASASGLVAGYSNVSTCAQICKRGNGEEYEYIKIIDKGINHNNLLPNGKKIHRVIEQEKKKINAWG